MKISFAARLVLTAVLLTTGASAAPVPANSVVKAPDWSAGSEWHYSDGYAVKVASVSPKGALFQRLDAPGQSFMRDGFIRTDSTSATATRKAIYRTVPDGAGLSLSAAKPLTFQREYLNNGKLMVHASSWTVEGRETITVPAGTFDCWVIVWRTRSLRSDWTGFERWWYSPDAQNYVRMEFKYGSEADGSRVLMNYRLAAASTPVAANLPSPAPASAVPQPPAPEPAAAPMPSKPIVPPKSAHVAALVPNTITPPTPALVAAPLISPAAAELKVAETRIAALVLSAKDKSKSLPENASSDTARPALEPVKVTPVRAVLSPMPKADKLGAWHAQLGATQNAAAIRAKLKDILAQNPRAQTLPSGVMVRNVEGRTFYRAWLGSYDDRQEAIALCKALKGVSAAGCAIFKGATMEARND
ncbi:MAG TPA: SPOR domain-containing protein [Rhizomicrobium sp.]